jgi:hypothetical protein
MAREEFLWKEIALETITPHAGGDEVARRVGASVGEREDVVEGGDGKLERSGAVDAPAAAVSHRGALDGVLMVLARKAPQPS